MIGKCNNCGQIKNLIKDLCSTCYQREFSRQRAKAKKAKAIVCIKCGTLLRNKNYELCTHCRKEKEVYERKIHTLFKFIEQTEKNIELCKAIENGRGYQELGTETGTTKQNIFNITEKGIDYYEQKLVEYKAKLFDLQRELNNFNQRVEKAKIEKL